MARRRRVRPAGRRQDTPRVRQLAPVQGRYPAPETQQRRRGNVRGRHHPPRADAAPRPHLEVG